MARPFCMGSGITMGTDGLKWPGADPHDDCVMLWVQTFGVSSAMRAVLASLVVFLLALLAQWLTSHSGQRLQEAKQRAKMQQRVGSAPRSVYYDPEQGINGGKAGGGSVNSASPLAVSASVTSVSIATRSVPAPASRSSLATPAASLMQYSGLSILSATSAVETAKVSDWEHLGDSALHGLRIFVAYLLMLAAMTYDVALITSIVFGFTLGYFLFTADSSKVPISADPCCS
ncbi:hypothetical protein PybrP1_001615 [[Pythium] brassicae (nom. inval.)]|nr:hypothetical protein PybrP1_001615 [[Pythium] brassicae (nom. inval.)]